MGLEGDEGWLEDIANSCTEDEEGDDDDGGGGGEIEDAEDGSAAGVRQYQDCLILTQGWG